MKTNQSIKNLLEMSSLYTPKVCVWIIKQMKNLSNDEPRWSNPVTEDSSGQTAPIVPASYAVETAIHFKGTTAVLTGINCGKFAVNE